MAIQHRFSKTKWTQKIMCPIILELFLFDIWAFYLVNKIAVHPNSLLTYLLLNGSLIMTFYTNIQPFISNYQQYQSLLIHLAKYSSHIIFKGDKASQCREVTEGCIHHLLRSNLLLPKIIIYTWQKPCDQWLTEGFLGVLVCCK